MKKYKVKIQFTDYNPIKKTWEEKRLSGYFEACNPDEASKEAKAYYTSELGDENISVLAVLEQIERTN